MNEKTLTYLVTFKDGTPEDVIAEIIEDIESFRAVESVAPYTTEGE